MSKRLQKYTQTPEAFTEMFKKGGNDSHLFYNNHLAQKCNALKHQMEDFWDTEEGETLWDDTTLTEIDRKEYNRLRKEYNSICKKIHLLKFHISALADFTKEYEKIVEQETAKRLAQEHALAYRSTDDDE